MNLQPSEFIAKTLAPDNNPQRIAAYNMVPGTVVRLRNHVFVLVDAPQGPPTNTNTNTDKENNND